MTNKNKTGLTRSENGKRYFDMKREANKPITDLFNHENEPVSARILRHLDLGTITLHFYNQVTKEEVTEVDVTSPFILNAKCYDSETRLFKNNNNVSRIIRGRLPCSYEQHIDRLEQICKEKGLIEEFNFFEQQFRKYKKQDDSWYTTSINSLVPYEEFYTGMAKRYTAITGKKFNLNPYALTYLQIIYVKNHYSPDPERTTITINDVEEHIQSHIGKLHIKMLPKPSILKKMLGSLFKWSGLTVDRDKLDINTFDDLLEDVDVDYRLNYEILPKIHTDYSRLAEIELETIPCELWVDLFKLNNGIPPFLVPDDTVDNFTEDQLKEIVKYAPRIILEWDKPELFNLDVRLPITEVYPILSHKQKCDQLTLVHLGYENRHLIPKSLTCISTLEKTIESHTANISEIYHLLSEELRIKHWKGFARPFNLAFIPDHRSVAADFEHLVVKTLFEHAVWTDTENPKLRFEKLHPILRREPERLFNTIIHLCEIGFDPQQTVEPHFYWKDRIEQIVLQGYEDFKDMLSPEVQNAIADCDMLEGCVVKVDSKLVAEFRKALHYNQLQAKIPLKINVPEKKNKI